MSTPANATPGPDRARVPVLRLMARLFAYRPALFWANIALWAAFHTVPVLFGYLASQFFARLEAVDPAKAEPGAWTAAWVALGLFAAARLGRFAVFTVAFRTWVWLWNLLDALVRRNLLAHLLTAPGARRLPDTPAEAVSRFRDDVAGVAEYTEYFVDASGLLLYAIVAIALLWRVDPVITVVVCAPLFVMVLLVRALSTRIRLYRRRAREATARVTDFVGETFAAVSAVKLAAREPLMVEHLRRLGETRRRAALRDVLLTELIRSVNTNMVNVGMGLVLLLAAAAIRAGTFTVAEFVLFATLLPRLANAMTFFGGMLAQHRRTGVNFERMARLAVDAPVEALVEHHDLHLRGEPPAPPAPPEREPLRELSARGLSAPFGDAPADGAEARGLKDVDLTLRRGEFVVVTGRIGSGKTTLLRALLGLVPATGEIRWNGRPVEDPATFFVPPRSAYTPQLPQLFSATLRENVVQGAGEARLEPALDLSVLRPDLAALAGGLETEVGARGVKLSGGQLSRTASARMFAREAELLVFDDLSSALDAETERLLWDGVFALGEVTCLVVSHRRAALARADRILVLDGGRVVAEGTLPDLLASSPQMRALWDEEARDEGLPGEEVKITSA